MCEALGIVTFENDSVNVQGLMDYRPVPAISVCGRYRVIDFVLSNFTNSGIDEIQVFVKNRPRSIIGHLNKANFNLNSKHGKLDILYGETAFPQEVYNHDIAAFASNMQFIEESNKPYVIIAPSYMIYSFDFNALLKDHVESKNDITMLYKTSGVAKEKAALSDVLTLNDGGRVIAMDKNLGKYNNRHIFLGAYCMSRQLFIQLIEKASKTSSLYWLSDIIEDSLSELNVYGHAFDGFVGCINSLQGYYKASMDLASFSKAKHLFKKDWPIYTVTNDSCPTRFDVNVDVKSSVVANGCQIEGTIKNSIIGRNVIIKKGAIIENSVILPGAFIGENAKLNCCVVDRYAIVNHVKKLSGTPDNPIYVKRRDRI